ncbi:Tda4 protein [Pichia kluyveri]|uniref:Tda4 protein n=1 Tax=Pichia kluyveri TaxID=36015 RepID=A0AAV5R090_PICKL|nr:Tda4 protein [Pichia kluyveri]
MKWYIDSDPFLALRPFPENPSNQLIEHWHEIVFFTIFFHVIMLIAPIINSKYFGKFYDDLKTNDPMTKINYDIRIVGIIQSTISALVCIPMFAHPQFWENPVRGSYPFAGLIASFIIGYFIWDLIYCCIGYYSIFGIEYLFHAAGALFVFGTTLIPFCQPFLCAFLIFELSTPFVQLHWMFTRSPKGMWSDKLITINGIFLITSFFFSRIIWGVYATIWSFFLCYPQREYYPIWLLPVVYVLNSGFQFLNFMWFSKMIKLAKRTISGGSSKKDK